jgi:hypothetical protein
VTRQVRAYRNTNRRGGQHAAPWLAGQRPGKFRGTKA